MFLKINWIFQKNCYCDNIQPSSSRSRSRIGLPHQCNGRTTKLDRPYIRCIISPIHTLVIGTIFSYTLQWILISKLFGSKSSRNYFWIGHFLPIVLTFRLQNLGASRYGLVLLLFKKETPSKGLFDCTLSLLNINSKHL